jgi:hypothetical protein
MRLEGRGREEGGGRKREEGRGRREEGRGKREEGRGKRKEGRGRKMTSDTLMDTAARSPSGISNQIKDQSPGAKVPKVVTLNGILL